MQAADVYEVTVGQHAEVRNELRCAVTYEYKQARHIVHLLNRKPHANAVHNTSNGTTCHQVLDSIKADLTHGQRAALTKQRLCASRQHLKRVGDEGCEWRQGKRSTEQTDVPGTPGGLANEPILHPPLLTRIE